MSNKDPYPSRLKKKQGMFPGLDPVVHSRNRKRWQGPLDEMSLSHYERDVSASLMLTDSNEFNGQLMLIPGSHQYFVPCVGETPQQNWKDSLKAQRVGVPDQDSPAARQPVFRLQ